MQAYQAELLAKECEYSRPGIQTMPWGSRAMATRDPFCNRLSFDEPAARGAATA